MDSTNSSKNNKNKSNPINSNSYLENIKSKYIFEKIFGFLNKNKSLGVVKYNKRLQKRLNININDYKYYSKIEIELIPIKNHPYSKFVNIYENESYYHIYFNDNKEEIKGKYYLNEIDNISKIQILIDYQIISFERLFKDCICIESINFKKFL